MTRMPRYLPISRGQHAPLHRRNQEASGGEPARAPAVMTLETGSGRDGVQATMLSSPAGTHEGIRRDVSCTSTTSNMGTYFP